jgi:hypothetical protein
MALLVAVLTEPFPERLHGVPHIGWKYLLLTAYYTQYCPLRKRLIPEAGAD